jgi:hypothetical protein
MPAMNFMNLTIPLEAIFNKDTDYIPEVTANKKVNSIKIRTPQGYDIKELCGFFTCLPLFFLSSALGRHGNPRMNIFHK